jgi:hypothetical protein
MGAQGAPSNATSRRGWFAAGQRTRPRRPALRATPAGRPAIAEPNPRFEQRPDKASVTPRSRVGQA